MRPSRSISLVNHFVSRLLVSDVVVQKIRKWEKVCVSESRSCDMLHEKRSISTEYTVTLCLFKGCGKSNYSRELENKECV